MSDSNFLYPLDLTGTQPSNRIVHEKHTVNPPSEITSASFIVARACPFFEHTLEVKDGTGPNARVLVSGQDYICTHQSITLTHFTKRPVFASITFVDRRFTGTVYISYQTVGGEYTLDDYTIIEQLTRDMYSIDHVSFDQIVGVPSSYPNPPHNHNPEDMVGLSEVVDKLNQIANALANLSGSYSQLQSQLEHHSNADNPHTPGQVGLPNVKNYGIGTVDDITNRANNKYITPDVINVWFNQQLQSLLENISNEYATKETIALNHPNKEEVYTKNESDNLYYSRTHIDNNFTKIADAMTSEDVGALVNTIVDTSQFLTRTDAGNRYYDKTESDTRFYTKSQSDNKFITEAAADNRYLQLLDPDVILSTKEDNILTFDERGKLYAGFNAVGDSYYLYIDCINGSDNNPGTKSAPLRTLKRANELTPSNRSSYWSLKHYTLDQMEKANSWYNWNFHCYLRNGAVRNIVIHGNTWIDGAKYNEGGQLADGIVNYLGIAEVDRLPVYINTYTSGNTENIFSIIFYDNSQIKADAIRFIKPKPDKQNPSKSTLFNGGGFFTGHGRVYLRGCWLSQSGDYGSDLSTGFCWLSQTYHQRLEITLAGCSYGYCNEVFRNSVKVFEDDLRSVFKYPDPNDRPFQYYYSTGIVKASPEFSPGNGAIAAGATPLDENVRQCLQRPKMFRGLQIVNGVCVNINTNLVLTD